MQRSFVAFVAVIAVAATATAAAAVLGSTIPSWEELDQRPLPVWYDDAKFGIFIHWGVFSVPAYGSEWFWYDWQTSHYSNYIDFIQRTERPHFTYPEYASRFRAELYQPKEWAQAFAQSGAQYVVLTSKHHDGYCKASFDDTSHVLFSTEPFASAGFGLFITFCYRLIHYFPSISLPYSSK
jgi:Alpha-L-fucosidase